MVQPRVRSGSADQPNRRINKCCNCRAAAALFFQTLALGCSGAPANRRTSRRQAGGEHCGGSPYRRKGDDVRISDVESKFKEAGCLPVVHNLTIARGPARLAFPMLYRTDKETGPSLFWMSASELGMSEHRDRFGYLYPAKGVFTPPVRGASYIRSTGYYRPHLLVGNQTLTLPCIRGTVAAMLFCDLLAEEMFRRMKQGFVRCWWADPEKEHPNFNCNLEERTAARKANVYKAVIHCVRQIDKHVSGTKWPSLPEELGKLIDDIQSGKRVLVPGKGRPKGVGNKPKDVTAVPLDILTRLNDLEKQVAALKEDVAARKEGPVSTEEAQAVSAAVNKDFVDKVRKDAEVVDTHKVTVAEPRKSVAADKKGVPFV